MPHKLDLVIDSKADLGEGPVWDSEEDVLYWVNITAGEVHIYDPATRSDRVINVGQQVGTVVPRKSGGLALALHHGFAFLDLATEELTMIADPESGLPDCRFNDGKCDPSGRFWAGTYAPDGPRGISSLYRLDADLSVHRMLTGISCSNGIAWSLDHRVMYYIDTPTGKVEAFDYDMATGAVADRRTVVHVPPDSGHPDGMTIDAEGMLWVAMWGGWGVVRYDPRTDRTLDHIDVPVAQTSSCAFGGPDLRDLYITTARRNRTEAQLRDEPLAGGLFVARPGPQGIAASAFAG